MRLMLPAALTALMMIITAGCDSDDTSKQTADNATNTEPLHAPEGAEPGSHEDWCGEHQVHESMCTRCNPSLTAAFKATGDWCAEHGLPESQCLACNPDLEIKRPPKSKSN